MDVIIVFLKITFIPVIFLLILTLISFILYLIGIPIVYRNHKAEKYFIQFFVSPVSIYLFSFVGAYNSLLALTFSPKTIVKIILIVYIFAILYSTFHKILKFEVFGLGNANKQDNELGEAVQNRIRFNWIFRSILTPSNPVVEA